MIFYFIMINFLLLVVMVRHIITYLLIPNFIIRNILNLLIFNFSIDIYLY